MAVLEFAAARLGKRVAAPGGLGGECVDLVELWATSLGAAPIAGNAADLLANADTGQWTAVSNGPANSPPAGAIVVWHEAPAVGIGRYGHTAICLAADGWWLLTLDQNWPAGAPVRVQLHSYAGVAGWLVRK